MSGRCGARPNISVGLTASAAFGPNNGHRQPVQATLRLMIGPSANASCKYPAHFQTVREITMSPYLLLGAQAADDELPEALLSEQAGV